MFGYVSVRPAEEKLSLRGARFCMAEVEAGSGLAARLSARRAARQLAGRGVKEAVFPADYPLCAVLAKRGVQPVSPVTLYRATAGAILRFCLAQQKQEPADSSVAFAAARVTAELTRAVWESADSVRHLTLAVDEGGEELAFALRRELGVAARVIPRSAIPDAAVTLCFDEGARPARGEFLPLYSPALRVQYAVPEEIAAPGCAENELLAALLRCGALQPEELAVRSIEAALDISP